MGGVGEELQQKLSVDFLIVASRDVAQRHPFLDFTNYCRDAADGLSFALQSCSAPVILSLESDSQARCTNHRNCRLILTFF